MQTLKHRLAALEEHLASLGRGLVLLSGGADSGFLAYAAARVLGDRARALSFEHPALPDWELSYAQESAAVAGLMLVVRELPLMELAEFGENVEDRCYFCKRLMFGLALETAGTMNLSAVMDGTNADDPRGHRPGLRAAKELGVVSPLMEVGLTGADVRAAAGNLELPAAGRAPDGCLATRVPPGTPVTVETLDLVRRAEARVRGLGFRLVRVRLEDGGARVEVGPDEIERLLQPTTSERVLDALHGLGLKGATLDPEGYKGTVA